MSWNYTPAYFIYSMYDIKTKRLQRKHTRHLMYLIISALQKPETTSDTFHFSSLKLDPCQPLEQTFLFFLAKTLWIQDERLVLWLGNISFRQFSFPCNFSFHHLSRTVRTNTLKIWDAE